MPTHSLQTKFRYGDAIPKIYFRNGSAIPKYSNWLYLNGFQLYAYDLNGGSMPASGDEHKMRPFYAKQVFKIMDVFGFDGICLQ